VTWEVRQGDVLELLATLRSQSVDAIVTDPPYGERVADWDRRKDASWYVAWLTEAARVLQPDAPLITFASRRYLDVVMGAVRTVFGDTTARPIQTGVWVHRQGFQGGRSGTLRPEHEPWIASGLLRVEADDTRTQRAYTRDRAPVQRQSAARGFRPTTYTPHAAGPMGGTVFEGARNGEERTDHPTQKPEAITSYLVALACPPDGLLLDLFTGSGTTGVCALRMGRRFLGFEQNGHYVDLARRRIGGPLFAAAKDGRP
jgi:site-specific DNA-methyltransferase (adenine-specific)